MIYNWEKIPSEFNWAITDEDGDVWVFVYEPKGFVPTNGVLWLYDHRDIHGGDLYDVLGDDMVLDAVPYLESLEQRPAG